MNEIKNISNETKEKIEAKYNQMRMQSNGKIENLPIILNQNGVEGSMAVLYEMRAGYNSCIRIVEAGPEKSAEACRETILKGFGDISNIEKLDKLIGSAKMALSQSTIDDEEKREFYLEIEKYEKVAEKAKNDEIPECLTDDYVTELLDLVIQLSDAVNEEALGSEELERNLESFRNDNTAVIADCDESTAIHMAAATYTLLKSGEITIEGVNSECVTPYMVGAITAGISKTSSVVAALDNGTVDENTAITIIKCILSIVSIVCVCLADIKFTVILTSVLFSTPISLVSAVLVGALIMSNFIAARTISSIESGVGKFVDKAVALVAKAREKAPNAVLHVKATLSLIVEKIKQIAEIIKTKVSEVAHKAKEKAQDVADKVKDKASDIVDNVKEKTSDVVDKVKERADEIKEKRNEKKAKA